MNKDAAPTKQSRERKSTMLVNLANSSELLNDYCDEYFLFPIQAKDENTIHTVADESQSAPLSKTKMPYIEDGIASGLSMSIRLRCQDDVARCDALMP
ncbi:MAG: hypothetical protein AB1656_16455 [Candidatus Omnitrophota bacterium]